MFKWWRNESKWIIKEEYYKTEHSYDENNQKYSNLIVYRKFKRLLELEIDKTKDSFLIDLYEELKNTDISEIDTIIVKYIRFMNTIDIDEVISDNFRLWGVWFWRNC